MRPRAVHDRAELAGLLGRDPARHAYQLGDLDEFFWPYTIWYRLGDSVALVYHGGALPTLLAFEPPDRLERLGDLLAGLAPLLPRRCYAHLSPGGEVALSKDFDVAMHGPHLKLALTDPARLTRMEQGRPGLAQPAAIPLTGADLPELLAFYEASYPGNWFDRRMLETGHYLGLRQAGELVAVAGVHVWSPVYRVSALGNVTTRPDLRGRGLGRTVVAALCRRLLHTVDHITLNVRADNGPAIALYSRLGFTPVAEYAELTLTARPTH
nr:GNAT family N-acetyltransferase [Micromonospora sp. DSM 115978]